MFLIILAIVIVLLLILFVLAIDWMTRYAYDRKSPKLPKFLVRIIMGNAKPVSEEEQRLTREQAARLKELANRTIVITGFDGVKLAGHYYPCEKPERILIAAHGWRSGWNYDYRTLAPFLHEHRTEKQMGLAALILGCGDAFHLVPRVLNYFIPADLTVALGIGKLITSITMTVFYVLMFYVWLGYFHEKKNRGLEICIWVCAAVRVVLCLFPQNGWLQLIRQATGSGRLQM